MIMLSLFAGLLLASPVTGDDPKPIKPASAVNKTVLVQLVNDARKKGCQCGDTWYPSAPPVSWNDLLEKAALGHSSDMDTNNFFSHTSSNGNKAGARIDAVGYNWQAYGENIGVGYETEKDVVAGWLKSPGHCKNIMNKNYKEMGVAKVGKYWTQTFGAR